MRNRSPAFEKTLEFFAGGRTEDFFVIHGRQTRAVCILVLRTDMDEMKTSSGASFTRCAICPVGRLRFEDLAELRDLGLFHCLGTTFRTIWRIFFTKRNLIRLFCRLD